jgi:hypothetical protein
MASIPNPYQAASPIGQAISNLGSAIFSGPSPIEQEQMRLQGDLMRAQTGSAEAKARQAKAQRQAQTGIAQLIGQVPAMRAATAAPVADPGVAGPARAQAATMAKGVRGDARQYISDLPNQLAAQGAAFVDSPKSLGDLFLFSAANDPNYTDNDVIRAQAGQGGTIGVNDAVSLAGQDRVRAANQANDMAMQDAKPITETQARGAAFGLLPPDAQATAVGPTLTEVQGGFANQNVNRLDDLSGPQQSFISAQPSQQTPRNYVSPAGASGITMDGLTDAQSGEPIPQGSSVFTGQVQTGDAAGLTTGSRTAAQARGQSLRDYQSLSSEVRSIGAQDPTLFGITGNVRRLGQNIVQQLENAQLLGAGAGVSDALAQAEADIAAATNGQYDLKNFDPNLSDIEKLSTLLAYNGAAALADQSGRGLSDKDFNMFRKIIGDPTSFFSSQAAFLAGLDRLDKQVEIRLKNTPGASGAPAAPSSPPGSTPAVGTIEDGYTYIGGDPGSPESWQKAQ